MSKKWSHGIGNIFIVTFVLLLSHTIPIKAEEISKLSLDDAQLLGTIITTDTKIKSEGNGSIKILTSWPTTICLGEVSGLDVESTKLVYQAKIKCENLQGTAFLEMWCHVGGGQYFSRNVNSAVKDTMDWRISKTPFMLQKDQRATKATLNIVINGKGTVWVDDIRLLQKPLK